MAFIRKFSHLLALLVYCSAEELLDFGQRTSREADWMSINENLEFQPAADVDERILSRYSAQFANTETYYDPYSQVWRLLGLYIDCEDIDNGNNRLLEDYSYGDDNYVCQYTYGCPRVLLWAAYVDLDYEGGGLGEYKVYDSLKGWDRTLCSASEGSRCVPMDCHKSNTGFKLLGYFKQKDPVTFMSYLLQHQGSCILSDDMYTGMSSIIGKLPKCCLKADVTASDGSALYYDLKPESNGGVGIGLYTDQTCSVDYTGHMRLSRLFGKDKQIKNDLKKLNQALDVFKSCKPCQTYDLMATENDFSCTDDLGYSNTNQCEMFVKNTETSVARHRDVLMASQQGSILHSHARGVVPSERMQWWKEWGFFLLGLVTLVIGIVASASVQAMYPTSNKEQPLI